MTVTAAMVKELRARTGAGMMDCKKALIEANGDIELAVDQMRKAGLATADKKASRIAAEGRVCVGVSDDGHHGVVVEINCETDFVSGGDDFTEFAAAVTRAALDQHPGNLEELLALAIDAGATVEETRRELVARIGENIQLRRIQSLESDQRLGTYLHGTRIGVLVAMSGGDDELARNIAMHIAWSNPPYLSEEGVPEDLLNKEKDILSEQARLEGKPDHIVEKMVAGRLKKYLHEITLLGQQYVKDTDISVARLLDDADATVTGYIRYEVGEGIDRKKENFAAEVMAQVKGDA
ncbi:MAG: translation elongation factor Ts [Gammaproteobacteria bacterium]